MNNHGSWKSDVLRLGILGGFCLLIGVCQIHKTQLINPDGVVYLDLAHKLPGDYVGVARTYPAGYPSLLWAAHAVAVFWGRQDSATLWLYSAQGVTLLCRMLALIPLYFLGKLLVGAERSFWALLILLVLPYPAQYAADVLREWPYVLFLGLGFWLLYWGLCRRRWWVLAAVGLAAGLGYLIRTECIQLVLYGLLGLASVALLGGKKGRALPLCGAGFLLVLGFLVPAAPNVLSSGILMPHQLRPHTSDAPPVIEAIGPKVACDDPLEFEVAEGDLLELPIHATDPDGDPLTFTLAGTPVGSRPVYQFWSMILGRHFWTIQENEKNHLLVTYPSHIWGYEGIAFYAYAQPNARTGLHGVHRLWSAPRQRHLYTMDEREKESVLQELPAGTWEYEGIVFYAFGEAGRPGDTVPVYRSTDQEGGYSWEVGEVGQQTTGTVAWYVHPAGEPPAGAGIEGGVFRWRPRAGQEGQYQINVIADDGELQSCQLVKIRVTSIRDGRTGDARPGTKEGVKSQVSSFKSSPLPLPTSNSPRCGPRLQHAGLELLPGAVDKAFDGVAEDLMVVFFVPWLLGLYWRLRYQAQRTERVLILAMVLANLALILGRHTTFGPGDDRRYSLGMIALTIFYVPVGIEVMAGWLNHLYPLARPRWMPSALRQSSWFYLLVTVGIVVCLPKLLMASPGNKAGYRAAAAWLQQNTKADAVLAVPDVRISFYAQRRGLPYALHPNARRTDYIVLIDDGDKMQVPQRWRREYSVLVDRRSKKTLTIYSTARSRR